MQAKGFSNNHPQHISRPPLEQRYIDETIASIRLRTRYQDPYEEWEKQTRKDALVSFEIHLFV
jgi:nucleoporin GLE1